MNEKGMTLLEVLIAVALLAFVMFGVISVTDNSQNAKDRTLAFNQDNLAIETALSRFETDILQLHSPLYYMQKGQWPIDPSSYPGAEEIVSLYENHPRFRLPSKNGSPVPIFRLSEKNDFLFFTSSHRRKYKNQKQSHFQWVRYFLGTSEKTEDEDLRYRATGGDDEAFQTGKALMRQVFPDDPWSKQELDFENTPKATLLENVSKMEISVWDPNTRKWEQNLAAIVDGDMIIRGVKLDIEWIDSQGGKRSTSRFFRPHWPLVAPIDPQDQTPPPPPGGSYGGALP